MFPRIEPDPVLPCHRFRCHKVEAGGQVKGWINGPIVVAVVHWSEPLSKPCYSAMSGGALPCKCADFPIAKRKIGYVPLLTGVGERIVVIVSNLVAAELLKLPHSSPIELHRSRVPCTPLRYKVWPNYECGEEKTKRVKTYTPVDIQPYLLHLWKAEALTRYYKGLNNSGAPVNESANSAPNGNSAVAVTPPAREDATVAVPSLINPRRKRKQAG